MYRLSSCSLLGFVALKNYQGCSFITQTQQAKAAKKTWLKADSWKLELGIHGNTVCSWSLLGVGTIGESQSKSFLWGQAALQGPPHCQETC